MRPCTRAICVLLLVVVAATSPGSTQGEAPPALRDITPEWFFPAWLGESAYAPSFQVRDTVNKYGRYAQQTKIITLKDLIKFHGHFCGGLVESAGALRLALDVLFPDGVIDRTDLRIISNNSACGGDVAAYLTGARSRFGSHHIDNTLKESEFIVQKVSTGETVRARVRPEAYPTDVRTQMKKIESGQFTPQDLDLFQKLQWQYARRLVTRPLTEAFQVEKLPDFSWPAPLCPDLGRRRDNDYKHAPEK